MQEWVAKYLLWCHTWDEFLSEVTITDGHKELMRYRLVKAVYWWCYMHTECPMNPSEMLRSMPTDNDIDLLYDLYRTNPKEQNGPVEWGDGIVWSELHNETYYPYAID